MSSCRPHGLLLAAWLAWPSLPSVRALSRSGVTSLSTITGQARLCRPCPQGGEREERKAPALGGGASLRCGARRASGECGVWCPIFIILEFVAIAIYHHRVREEQALPAAKTVPVGFVVRGCKNIPNRYQHRSGPLQPTRPPPLLVPWFRPRPWSPPSPPYPFPHRPTHPAAHHQSALHKNREESRSSSVSCASSMCVKGRASRPREGRSRWYVQALSSTRRTRHNV